jgi:hypothetical protein
MRWFVLTVVLLAVCAAGAAWIYFRDWERPSETQHALVRAAHPSDPT